MKNCRFLVFINGDDVKLTLRPGQTLHHYQGGPTEEGWSSYAESWYLSSDSQVLTRESVSDGVDCDGRLTRYSTDYADADPDTFHSGHDPYKTRPALFPYWKEGESSQRDQYAELAGY